MDSSSPSSQKVAPVVHVSNLSYKTTSSELQAIFSRVAPVVKIALRVRSDNASAFAFVTFCSLEDCQRIMKEFNYHPLHNKQMNIIMLDEDKKISPEANVFVKNLPPNLNSKDLHDLFKVFGDIVSCKVASNVGGELKRYGFVQYRQPKFAKKAIAACKNVKIDNCVLEVESYDRTVKESRLANARQPIFTNCYIKDFPTSLKEEDLRKILEKYGRVDSLYFPLKEDGTSLGFACANYTSPEDAMASIENLHGKSIFSSDQFDREPGVSAPTFYIQRAESKKDRAEVIKRQLDNMSIDGQKSKCNLYVSNIPRTFSREEVLNIFLQFGTITGFKLSNPGPSATKQYGYICYSTPQEAALAYEKADGTYLDGSKIQISFYKTKVERMIENKLTGGASMSSLPDSRSLVFLDNEAINLDVPRRRNLLALYNALLMKADAYSSRWKDMGIESPTEFAQRLTLSAIELSLNDIKEMVQHGDALHQYIESSIKTAAVELVDSERESKNLSSKDE